MSITVKFGLRLSYDPKSLQAGFPVIMIVGLLDEIVQFFTSVELDLNFRAFPERKKK